MLKPVLETTLFPLRGSSAISLEVKVSTGEMSQRRGSQRAGHRSYLEREGTEAGSRGAVG